MYEHPTVSVLDEERSVSFTEFCGQSGLAEALIIELVTEGILDPAGNPAPYWLFSTACVARARRALRLRADLELNWAAVAVILPLLEELEELRRRQQHWGYWRATREY